MLHMRYHYSLYTCIHAYIWIYMFDVKQGSLLPPLVVESVSRWVVTLVWMVGQIDRWQADSQCPQGSFSLL